MKNAIHTFNIDHIIPLDNKGTTSLDNLALSCGGCNSAKSNKLTAIDPVTKQIAPIFNPRKQDWVEHFAWSDTFLKMLGLTPTGRASIKLLKLNRKGVINMRKLTMLIGEHPPTIKSDN